MMPEEGVFALFDSSLAYLRLGDKVTIGSIVFHVFGLSRFSVAQIFPFSQFSLSSRDWLISFGQE
jgi:hypothetical protein